MAKQPEMNLIGFIAKYGTENKCIKRLFKHKWPNGFKCEKCGCTKYYSIKTRGHYECRKCHYQASVTANTIMHRSHTPLRKWFVAIYLVSRDKRGFSALTLQKNIGVSYPTAWLMIHKIRDAMLQRDDGYLLADIVEVDEAFFGASGGKQGRGTQKAKVIVQVSLTEDGNPQFAKMTMVDDVKTETINSVVKENIKKGSLINSDDFKSYKDLVNQGYQHNVVNMKDEGPETGLKWLHIIVSNAKSYVLGTYHGLDKMHLQRYLDEFCYRFNRRFFEFELFDRLLEACAVGDTITYNSLIIRKPKEGNKKKVRILA